MPQEPKRSAGPTTFPRENARTQRYTLGRPRSFTVAPDGSHVLFVRSAAGDGPIGQLWRFDSDSGSETLLLDPGKLLGTSREALSASERARRERLREAASGVVSYSTDEQHTKVCLALSSRLFVLDLTAPPSPNAVKELEVPEPVVDPRLDPTGRWIAYTSGGRLHVVGSDGPGARVLAEPATEHQMWGSADFVAAEEFDRTRGFWWAPDGQRLIVEHVNEEPVPTWWVADPANPQTRPTPHRYPAAGAPNAQIQLWLVDLEGQRTEITWDADAYEYVTSVSWTSNGPPMVQVLDRSQRRALILTVDIDSGATQVIRQLHDDCWVDVVSGVPAWLPDGELLTVEVCGDTYTLCVNGKAVTPPGLQVRDVVHVPTTPTDAVLFTASEEPTEQHLWRWQPSGLVAMTDEPGVHHGIVGGGTMVTVSATLKQPTPIARVHHEGKAHVVQSLALTPRMAPTVDILRSPNRDLRYVVLLPEGIRETAEPLPVLLDPYGGPHAQRVTASQGAYRESQWFANQGFAVVVADGRGTPRSPSWERAVRGDLAKPVLEDQIEALQAAAIDNPSLDISRVGIRGWSFGGYLAALAVLLEPNIFHAAIAGAPVTDWRLYDTGYTERYLGLPDENPADYENSSLLELAATLRRPLMLIHGLADDNVYAAHSLQLSARLTSAGRPHTVLPLSGVTHMASQEDVAENLLLLQVEFLRNALETPRLTG